MAERPEMPPSRSMALEALLRREAEETDDSDLQPAGEAVDSKQQRHEAGGGSKQSPKPKAKAKGAPKPKAKAKTVPTGDGGPKRQSSGYGGGRCRKRPAKETGGETTQRKAKKTAGDESTLQAKETGGGAEEREPVPHRPAPGDEGKPEAPPARSRPKPRAALEGAVSKSGGQDRHSAEGKENKKLYSKLNYHLGQKFPDKLQEFKQLDWPAKQAWAQKFLRDPSCAWLTATSEHAVGSRDRSDVGVEWLTEEQLASPQYLNSAKHAKMVFQSNSLPTRPHDVEALAAAGVVQVRWTRETRTFTDFSAESTTLQATGDISQEDFGAVRAQMAKGSRGDGSGGGGAIRQPMGTPLASTDEQKVGQEAKRQRGRLLQQARQVLSKVTAHISGASMKPIMDKLEARPWGEAAKKAIDNSIEELEDELESLRQCCDEQTLRAKASPTEFQKEELEVKLKRVLGLWGALDKAYIGDAKALK